MKKLLKNYGFTSDAQYFEMIAESVINGQRTQARNQFSAMPKKDKKAFLLDLFSGNWNLDQKDKEMFLNEL